MSEKVQAPVFPSLGTLMLRTGFVMAVARINWVNEMNSRGLLGQSNPQQSVSSTDVRGETATEIMPPIFSVNDAPITDPAVVTNIDSSLLNRLTPERRREMIQRAADKKK